MNPARQPKPTFFPDQAFPRLESLGYEKTKD
jgi:hypothetical protein